MIKDKTVADCAPDLILPSIYDAHVHVGQFEGKRYFAPGWVCNHLVEIGVAGFAFSSLSTSGGNYMEALDEIDKVQAQYPGRSVPLLWVTPELVETRRAHDLCATNHFHGLKIHCFADGWDARGSAIQGVFDLAVKFSLPLLVHTGWTPESEAGNFNEVCSAFPDVPVILAHARPLDQAIYMLQRHCQLFVDTAYVSLHNLRCIVNAGLGSRIIFGSDFPVDRHYYPRASLRGRYIRRLNLMIGSFGKELVVRWGRNNFFKVFGDES